MPTYLYACPAGHQHEHFVVSTSLFSRKRDCPRCGRPASLIISPVAPPVFRGSGFYETDYKRKSADGNKEGKKE